MDHPQVIRAKQGERVELSAVGSYDPDGDQLNYHWFYYPEAGSFAMSVPRGGQPLEIHGYDQEKAWFEVPTKRVLRTGSLHIILAVTDEGVPSLTRYKRVIVEVD